MAEDLRRLITIVSEPEFPLARKPALLFCTTFGQFEKTNSPSNTFTGSAVILKRIHRRVVEICVGRGGGRFGGLKPWGVFRSTTTTTPPQHHETGCGASDTGMQRMRETRTSFLPLCMVLRAGGAAQGQIATSQERPTAPTTGTTAVVSLQYAIETH